MRCESSNSQLSFCLLIWEAISALSTGGAVITHPPMIRLLANRSGFLATAGWTWWRGRAHWPMGCPVGQPLRFLRPILKDQSFLTKNLPRPPITFQLKEIRTRFWYKNNPGESCDHETITSFWNRTLCKKCCWANWNQSLAEVSEGSLKTNTYPYN